MSQSFGVDTSRHWTAQNGSAGLGLVTPDVALRLTNADICA
jgi:hypothetical protein